ncbi:costunolide synthase, partial [Tanacetum coccineum]
YKDHLGKFDKKADDGYFLGYSLVSKAFKVFNTRRQQTEETFHITFDESTEAIKFSKPSVDSNVVQFIEPYERPKPIFTEFVASLDQNDQADQNDQRLGELAPTKLIIELADRTIKRPKGIAENILVGIDKFVFPVNFIVLDMPEDIKVPLILGIPFFSTAHVKIDVFKRKITLRVGDDKIVFKSDNPTSNIIKRVYVRNQEVDDLGSKIEEGEVIDEPMMDIIKTRNDDEMIDGIDEYLNFCDFDRKIHIDFVENINAFRDKDIGEVIVGKPFCKEVCVKAR